MASRILRLSNNLRNVSKRLSSSAASPHKQDYQAATLRLPETECTILDNTLKVASENTGGNTATVGLWIDAGSRYETPRNNGVGNLIDQLILKGTTSRSKAALEAEIASIGARLDTVHTREETGIVARCLSKHVPKIVEILSDCILNPKFDEAELERARTVVLRQLDEQENDTKKLVLENLHVTAYQGTPLGLTTIGPVANLQRLTRDHLDYYIATHFKAHRTVLAVSGGVEHRELTDLANKHLGKLNNSFDGEVPVLERCRYTSSDVRIRDDAYPVGHIAVAIEGPGWNSADHLPMEIVKTYLGSWDWTQLTGENHPLTLAKYCGTGKLCHSYETFNIAYKDTGLFGHYFVCDPLNCENTEWNISQELMRLCNILTETEATRAKNTYKANALRQIEGTVGSCYDIGRQVLRNGQRVSYSELVRQIDAISAERLSEVASHYIYDRHPVVSAIGQVENLLDLNRITDNFFWVRS